MQKRPLTAVFLLSVITLGAYDLVWLHKTRQELTQLTSVRIPSIGWLVLLNSLRLAGFVLAIVLTVMVFAANKSTSVSSACWSEYVLSSVPETAGQVTLTKDCRDQVARSDAATSKEDKLIKGYLLVVVLLFVSTLGYPRWLRNYALAVQQITNGKLSQTMTMFMLVFAPAYGMVAVQNVFNGISPSDETV